MASDGKRLGLFDLATSICKSDKVSPPNQLSPSAAGRVNTDGNDRDNSSRDNVRDPDNSSSGVTSQLKKFQNDLSHLQKTLGSWHEEADELSKKVTRMMTESQKSTSSSDLQEVKREILSLKLNLLARQNRSKAKSSTPGLPKVGEYQDRDKMLEKLRNKFIEMPASSTIQGVLQLYDRLEDNHKNCLLCLTAFPENAIIKKRVLINWWVGLEFLVVQDSNGSVAIKQAAEKIFEELGKKGFIMLVHKNGKKRSPVPDSCQLHPFMWWVLKTLPKADEFLYFDSQGTAVPKHPQRCKACLVEDGQLSRTLSNMNEQFLVLKRCEVLQLGQWVVSPDRNINVDDVPSLLKGMSTMKNLRYLSLQGVTNIRMLPDSLRKLSNLTILDLKACRSLEELPTEIGYLKELTYLDFSECYMISHMPKSLAKLEKLQVLKGFVLHDDAACSLSDLAGMQNLWKLSLQIDKPDDLGAKQIDHLSKLCKLTSLTITWILLPEQSTSSHGGTDSNSKSVQKNSKKPPNSENSSSGGEPFFHRLRKLDLRGYPKTSMPAWVTPSNLKELEKLYIRGGNLVNLNQDSHPHIPRSVRNLSRINLWSVKILRLRFLAHCEIEWLDLRDHFPSLVYLENFGCKKLKLFPCDGYGVWMNPLC